MAFSHWENARWINEEGAIYPHFLRFTKRKMLRFRNVFTPVNSRIRSIIHQFSDSVNASKHAFADVHRSVNTRWTSCIPAFTLSFQTENLEFTAVNEWNPAFCGRFPAFSETVNTAESRKIACIPAFTDRLPLGKLRVIPTFASSFLAFSLIFRDSEFK